MSNPEPVLNWADSPESFRTAHEQTKAKLAETEGRLAEVDQLKRQNAFLRAGLDPEHPGYSFFDAGYTGKLETEDIRSTWNTTFGDTSKPPAADQEQPPDPDGSDPEVAAQLSQLQQDRAKLTTDGTPPGEEPSPDPQQDAIAIFQRRQAEGATRDQAPAAAFTRIFEAANAGDERIVSHSAEEAQNKWKRKHGF